MASPNPLYRLVVFDEVDDQPAAVRDLFCRVTGLHPTDAMLWIARTPGVWPRPLPDDQARALLDGLYDLRRRGRGVARPTSSPSSAPPGRSTTPPAWPKGSASRGCAASRRTGSPGTRSS